jgi:hypothetical protein
MTQTLIEPPGMPSGQEIFDRLMEPIEPELISKNFQSSADKYRKETPEQFSSRKERYVSAFRQYHKAYKEYIQSLRSGVRQYRRSSFQQIEQEDRQNEDRLFQQLSQSLKTAL